MIADTIKTYMLFLRMRHCLGMIICFREDSQRYPEKTRKKERNYYGREFLKAYNELSEEWQEYVFKNFPTLEEPCCPNCGGTGDAK